MVEIAVVGGARCLGWPSGCSWGASRHLVLLGPVIRLVARLAVGEAHKLWGYIVVPLGLLLTRVASSSCMLSSEVLVVRVLVVPSEVPAQLAGARAVAIPELCRRGTLEPLSATLTGLVVCVPLLLALAIYTSQSFLLHGNGTVHHVAERRVVAFGHDLAYPVVHVAMEPELLLLVGVHIVGCVPHHLGEVALIFLHPHGSLGHGAKLLRLLDDVDAH